VTEDSSFGVASLEGFASAGFASGTAGACAPAFATHPIANTPIIAIKSKPFRFMLNLV
jgi:hypothetical protein